MRQHLLTLWTFFAWSVSFLALSQPAPSIPPAFPMPAYLGEEWVPVLDEDRQKGDVNPKMTVLVNSVFDGPELEYGESDSKLASNNFYLNIDLSRGADSYKLFWRSSGADWTFLQALNEGQQIVKFNELEILSPGDRALFVVVAYGENGNPIDTSRIVSGTRELRDFLEYRYLNDSSSTWVPIYDTISQELFESMIPGFNVTGVWKRMLDEVSTSLSTQVDYQADNIMVGTIVRQNLSEVMKDNFYVDFADVISLQTELYTVDIVENDLMITAPLLEGDTTAGGVVTWYADTLKPDEVLVSSVRVKEEAVYIYDITLTATWRDGNPDVEDISDAFDNIDFPDEKLYTVSGSAYDVRYETNYVPAELGLYVSEFEFNNEIFFGKAGSFHRSPTASSDFSMSSVGRFSITVKDAFGEVGFSELEGPGMVLSSDPANFPDDFEYPDGAVIFTGEGLGAESEISFGKPGGLIESGSISWNGANVTVTGPNGPVASPVTFDGSLSIPTLTFASGNQAGVVNISFEADMGPGVNQEYDVALHIVDAPSNPPAAPNLSIPADDMAGPRYRKLSLLGRPMPDEKPQATAETDEAKEQTYIDAFSLGLNHSTTDIYQPIPGSDLALTVKRNAVSEIWSEGSGLRPHERADLAFGAGWRSNLGAHVKFVVAPKQVPYAYVTDADGATHQFAYAGAGRGFVPLPSASHEAKQVLYEFEMTGGDFPSIGAFDDTVNVYTPPTFQLRKKFGKTLEFEGTSLQLTYSSDRLNGSTSQVAVTYARLKEERDRLGYKIVREYPPGDRSLLPVKLQAYNAQNVPLAGQQIFVRQVNGRVTDVWDALGNQTSYAYVGSKLAEVVRSDSSKVEYGYEFVEEPETIPKAGATISDPMFHLNLNRITNGRGHAHQFEYVFNHDKEIFVLNEVANGFYVQIGQPRRVSKVILPTSEPGNEVAAHFSANHPVQLSLDELDNESFQKKNPNQEITTTVTDVEGNVTTYIFDDIELAVLEDFKEQLAGYDDAPDPRLLLYKKMAIEHPTQVRESFEFDPVACMALVKITDYSQNVTEFIYSDPIQVNTALNVLGPVAPAFYDDPNEERKLINGAVYATTQYEYDDTTRVMKEITDPEGHRTEYEIDAEGRRVWEKVHDATLGLLKHTDFVYGDNDFPGVVTDTTVNNLNGRAGGFDIRTSNVLDGFGRVWKQISYPGGGNPNLETETVYDLANNKRGVYDPKDQVTVFEYDPRNRITKVIHHDNSFKQMEYDLGGNLTKEWNERGFLTEHQYDELNRRWHTKVATGSNPAFLETTTAYTDLGLPEVVTDPRGTQTQTEYDLLLRPTKVTQALGLPEQTVVDMFYDGANAGGSAFNVSGFKPTRIERVVSGLTYETENTYDELYRLKKTRVLFDVAGNRWAETETVYDKVGNPVQVTDPLDQVTTTVFDGLKRPTMVTYADGSVVNTLHSSTGLTWKVEEQVSAGVTRTTETLYDGMGRATKVIAPPVTAGTAETETLYDDFGRVLATIDPLDRRTDFQYDTRNRKTHDILPEVEVVGEDGVLGLVRPTIVTAYDEVGNVISVTDPRGHTTTTEYDGLNRPFRVTDPLGQQTQSVYDETGNVTDVYDANGYHTQNAYDALNRLESTTSPEGITVSYEYDEDSNRTAVIAGNPGQPARTDMTYDGLKRLLKTIHPDGNDHENRYDELNKIEWEDELGRVTEFSYDVRHRLTTLEFHDGNIRTMAYDDVGNLLSVNESANAKATVGYVYDLIGQVTSETTNGVTHQFEYDLAGNRTKTTVGHNSRVIDTEYNEHGKIEKLIEGTRETNYRYDAVGNLRERSFSNGQKVAMTYDVLNRASTREATANGSVLQSFVYGYDKVGNVLSMEETYGKADVPSRVVNLVYDRDYRLKSENIFEDGGGIISTVYTYDESGNRTSKEVLGGDKPSSTTSAFNVLNQVQTITDNETGEITSFDYDLNGNLVELSRTDGEITTFSYDPSNRLTQVVENGKKRTIDITGPDELKAEAQFTVSGQYDYAYDYRTRRLSRNENGIKTDIVFLGGTSVMEFEGAGNQAEPDRASAAIPAVEYIRGSDLGGGIGGILYSLRDGQPSFTWYNNRGDVVAKTDDSGALQFQAAYEAFGTRTAEGGETEDRQRANTREETPWGGLYENMRWRLLETGTYMTRDPAGFVDGPNLYTYVRQNPWTGYDPLGLEMYIDGVKQTKESLHYDKQNADRQNILDHYLDTNYRFDFSSKDQMVQTVRFRENVLKNMRSLMNSRLNFPEDGTAAGLKVNTKYWRMNNKHPDGVTFEPTWDGMTDWEAAIGSLFNSNTSLDCHSACNVAYLAAYAKTVGIKNSKQATAAFGTISPIEAFQYGKIQFQDEKGNVLPSKTDFKDLLKGSYAGRMNNLNARSSRPKIPGDWVYFQNHKDYGSGPYVGEHAIYTGKNGMGEAQFLAHPMGHQTQTYIRTELKKALIKQTGRQYNLDAIPTNPIMRYAP